jgi:UDP-N-acetylmuramoylalanine--D-glutamate ligase
MRKEIVILGAGESGVGAALLAKSKGLDVFVSDKGNILPRYRKELENADISFEDGGHSEERILQASEVIKSPGIPDNAPLIVKLKQSGIPVIAEIEFAGRYSNAHMIGITGSNGKTTTTLWLYHILQLAGKDAVLSGNVGHSPCRILAKRDPEIFVMELSSFQLDGMSSFRVNTAILTNITPDHLDRYDYKFENYIASKFRILNNQKQEDVFIWCADDPVSKAQYRSEMTSATALSFSLNHKAAGFLDDEKVVLISSDIEVTIPINEIALKGRHNLYNAMAAGLAAIQVGASPKDVVEGLKTFKGVEHRLEFSGEVNGVEYINDSKATNVNSTWFALESMTRPVVWIAGGTDKGNDYSELTELAANKVKALICLGVDNTKLINAFAGIIPIIKDTKSMDEALREAQLLSSSGDAVLLSPACASFDLFNNYEHRGTLFKAIVSDMIK